jgi:hypothetical protein
MEEDSIWIHPPNDQDVHIYCGPGEGPFVPCHVFNITASKIVTNSSQAAFSSRTTSTSNSKSSTSSKA